MTKLKKIKLSNGILFQANGGQMIKFIISISCGYFVMTRGIEGTFNFIFNPQSLKSFDEALFNTTLILFVLIYGLIQIQQTFLWERIENNKFVAQLYWFQIILSQSLFTLMVSFIVLIYFFMTTVYYLFGWFNSIEDIIIFDSLGTYMRILLAIYLFYIELKFRKVLSKIEYDF